MATDQAGPLGWLEGLVSAPIRARALNGLDLIVAVWPARALAGWIGGAAALTALHVGLVAAAAAAGVGYARAVGASALGAAAGGLVAGASGLVLTTVGIGPYPQALVIFPLAWFAGFARVWRGERGGVPLAILGGAGSLLTYWLYAPILAVGTVVLALGAWMVRWPVGARAGRNGTLAMVGIVGIVAPFAHALSGSVDAKLAAVPWGTPYFSGPYWRDAAAHVVGEVPGAEL